MVTSDSPIRSDPPITRNAIEASTSSSDAFGADVDRLCNLLADLIVENGATRRPNITKKWRQECDRLMRLDGHTAEQVEKAIRWCQADPFWRGVILSMPNLREKYERLRLAAKRELEQRNGPGSSAPRPLPTHTTGEVAL